MIKIYCVKIITNNGVDNETAIHNTAFMFTSEANDFILSQLKQIYDKQFINRPTDYEDLDDYYLLSTYVGIYTKGKFVHTAYYTIEEMNIEL
jgi:hypothetical protein